MDGPPAPTALRHRTRLARLRRAAPNVAVLASMTSVQFGAALSVTVFDTFEVIGTIWLRLAIAAAILTAITRPRRIGRRECAAAVVLGLVMAINAVTFSYATDHIPLGVTVAVEFCGPLTLAAIGARAAGARRLLWPLAALAGVLLLTDPWVSGGATVHDTWIGLGFAVAAGVGWAGYIVLTAHVGRRSEGLGGLAVALMAAALALAPFGVPRAWPAVHAALLGSRTDLDALAVCALAALLVPLTAFALEMAALRRLEQHVFGVWMALEPAIGVLVGLLVLGQRLSAWQLPGVLLVVCAGIGAQRASRTRQVAHPHPSPR